MLNHFILENPPSALPLSILRYDILTPLVITHLIHTIADETTIVRLRKMI